MCITMDSIEEFNKSTHAMHAILVAFLPPNYRTVENKTTPKIFSAKKLAQHLDRSVSHFVIIFTAFISFLCSLVRSIAALYADKIGGLTGENLFAKI